MLKRFRIALFVALVAVFAFGCSSDDNAARNGTVGFTVTATAGEGGAIEPASLNVAAGKTAALTVTPDEGFDIDVVEGCGGTLDGEVFTTAPVHKNCEVVARFVRQTFTLGGKVHGLEGIGLLLRNHDGVERTPNSVGNFEFPAPVAYGEAWEVTVAAQPANPAQTCTAEPTSGTVKGHVHVAVTCESHRYPIEVDVTGLKGEGLLLRNNGGDDLALTGNGRHAFPTELLDLESYDVTIEAQPTNPLQTCTLLDRTSGVVAAAGVSMRLNCVTEQFSIGVTVTGLTTDTLVLRKDGTYDLEVTTNGTYQFPTALDDGSAYEVTVATEPDVPGRSCRVQGGDDALAGRPAWVWVACTNYALDFDGSSGSVVFPSEIPVPSNGEAYTVEAWIRPKSMGLGGIAAWGNYGVSNQAIAFRLTADGLSTSWWGSTLNSAPVDLTDGWHHVASSWDGTTRRLFIDGVEVASDEPAAPHAIPDGRDFRLGLGYDDQYFDGAVDDVRVWSTALTAGTLEDWRFTEILDGHPHRDDLIGAWAFRRGMGSSVTETTVLDPALGGELNGGVAWMTVEPGATVSPQGRRLPNGGVKATLTATAWDEYRAPTPVTSWVSERDTVVDVVSTGSNTAEVTTGFVGLARIYALIDGAVSRPAVIYSRTSGPRTIHVDPDQTASPEGGRWWYEALASLREALLVATTGDEIWVAEGAYTPTDGADRGASFVLKNGVKIYGGFQGTETARSERNPDLYVTTLSGLLADGESRSYHVVTAEDVNSSAGLDGFTITNGYALGAGEQSYGGGMFVRNASPALAQLKFVENEARYGGGLYASDAELTLTDSRFDDNVAVTHGGGINTGNGTLHLSGVVFEGNSSSQGGGGRIAGTELTIEDSTFLENTASGNGGGLYTTSTDGFYDKVTFKWNTSGESGGGLYATSSSGNRVPRLHETFFVENEAEYSGAGIAAYYTTPEITRANIRGNSLPRGVPTFGGGIYLYSNVSTPMRLTNVVLTGNSARYGGAVDGGRYSRAELVHTSLVGNYAEATGGAIRWTGPSLQITNSLFWQNDTADDKSRNLELFFDTTVGPTADVTVTYSLLENGCAYPASVAGIYSVYGALSCSNVVSGDPHLATSPVGPDGIAGTADDIQGNVRLSYGSAAVDAGDNSVWDGVASPVDMANDPRIVNGTVDMGAYEMQ